MIHRLSYSMPPHVLTTLANGLLMGKILAACPVTIPVRITDDDRSQSHITVTEEINMAMKSTARTITKTKLLDKVCSEDVLAKVILKCLNETVGAITAATVWKSKQSNNPLKNCLSKIEKS